VCHGTEVLVLTVETSQTSTSQSVQQQSHPERKKTVLIIDDQSTGRTILQKVIQPIEENLVVEAMETPHDALAWIKTNDPDLIITDYRMPDMNGVEFIRQVRQQAHCEAVPIVMITVMSEKEIRYEALESGATAFLTRPIDPIECRTTCRNLLKMHEQQLIIQDRADWLAKQVDKATEQIIQREKETLLRLARAGEYRDEGTGNHVIRMAKYSRLIAEALGTFSEQECEDLEYAAPMHDIGKIGIPDGVLLKPGKLNPQEWDIMQTHTTIGHAILSGSQSRYMRIGAVIALNHHERFDGKGYPNGLTGNEIPLIARVVAVADIFDALVSARPYKAAWTADEAVEYIKQQSGTHLDPDCVSAFLKQINRVLEIHEQFKDEDDFD
jgi:two-component system response regulator RpfG